MIRPAVSRAPHRLAAIFSIALSGLILMPPGMAAADKLAADEIRATARQVLIDGYYQSQAPGQRDAEALAAENEMSSAAPPSGTDAEASGQAVDHRTASPATQVGTAFLWVLVAIAGLLFAFQTVRLLLARFRRMRPAADSLVTVRANAAPSEEQPLAAADNLAGAGSSGDAVRLLLLAALEELRRRLGGTVAAPALTAREVMRTPMPPRARAALAILVESEERGRFGGRVVDHATYRACRACYVRFTAWLEARLA